ncbi:MAG: rhomboid-like protein [Dermatophilaceae bacterium]
MMSVVAVLVLMWYALRGAARWSSAAAWLVARLRPRTRQLHAWVLSAPATFSYIAIFSASTVIARDAPSHLITMLTIRQGTSPVRLAADPAVLLTSALWVANGGTALGLYVAVFATVVAWAERRYGPPRIIVIGAAGHILGSLLTALVLRQAIDHGYLSARLVRTADVGVSYVLVAAVAAAVVLWRGWRRTGGAAVLGAALLIPLAVNRTVWDLGHILAATSGLVAAVVLLGFAPARPRPRWPVSGSDCTGELPVEQEPPSSASTGESVNGPQPSGRPAGQLGRPAGPG